MNNSPVSSRVAASAMLAGALLAVSTSTAAAQTTFSAYTITAIGPLAGDSASWAIGLNDAGYVAGTSSGTATQGVVYANGALTGTGWLGDSQYSAALDISNKGHLLWESMAPDYRFTTMVNYQGATTALPSQFNGFNINDAGVVAGNLNQDGVFHAAIADGQHLIDLGTLPGQQSSWVPFGAQAINAKGQVVGASGDSQGVSTEAFVYSNGVMTGLGVLPGMTWSYALAINDHGQIVGASGDASGRRDSFIYENGAMRALGITDSIAYGINNAGQIVGLDFHLGGAWLYQDGSAAYLRSLIEDSDGLGMSESLNRVGINNAGQIVLNGAVYPAGGGSQPAAFLLDPLDHAASHPALVALNAAPVPEPAPLAMLALGGLMLAAARRRRPFRIHRSYRWMRSK